MNNDDPHLNENELQLLEYLESHCISPDSSGAIKASSILNDLDIDEILLAELANNLSGLELIQGRRVDAGIYTRMWITPIGVQFFRKTQKQIDEELSGQQLLSKEKAMVDKSKTFVEEELKENQSDIDNQRFQILSLDGGGIKGLFSAAVLAAIEEDLEINVVDRFDLITGTSTGGIIALGLGIGMRPREIVEFYISKGPAIFNKMWGLRWWQHWIRRKFSQTPLKQALETCFKDKRLGDCTKRIVIPSYNVGDDDVYLFRTPHHERLRRDRKVPLWKIALATSAAPTFFPSCRHVDRLRLIDGGVWANNPSMVGVVEAYGTLGIPLNEIKVFSIGTTDTLASRKDGLDSGGKFSWVTGNDAVDIIMRGQSIGVNNQTKFLLGQNNVIRWDPIVAASEFSLDGVGKVDALFAKAAHYSRIHIPRFKEIFADHIAKKYEPFYS